MIEHINITGIRYTPDETVKKYVTKKIGRLSRYVPRSSRKSLHADVKLAEVNRDKGNKYEVEIIIHAPDKIFTAKDSTMNVLAAVDIVEAKLAAQLRRFKDDTVSHVGHRKILARFKRSFGREAQ